MPNELTIPAGAGGFLVAIAEHVATTTGANEHQADDDEPDYTDYCDPQCEECPHCTGCGGSATRSGPYGCVCDELDYDCGSCRDEGCEHCEGAYDE